MLTPEERALRMKGLIRDRAARRRLADNALPDLPVDGDPPELRRRAERIGDSMKDTLDSLLKASSPFFEKVVSEWESLLPGVSARPVGFEDGARGFRIVLSVANAGQSFALRPQLPRIRRALKAIDGAPGRIALAVRIG